MPVPRGFYRFLTLDFQGLRKIRPVQFFRAAKRGGRIYPTAGKFCRTIGRICLVFEIKTAPLFTAPLPRAMCPAPYPLKRESRYCGDWLAMESAWTPSCCLTCRDCSSALSLAMSASTRLPTPVVSVSESFDAKPSWIENFFEPAESCASAESTFSSDCWMTEIIVEAPPWVEIEAPVEIVTIEPDRLMFCAAAVMRREPSEEASAVIVCVEPSTRL